MQIAFYVLSALILLILTVIPVFERVFNAASLCGVVGSAVIAIIGYFANKTDYTNQILIFVLLLCPIALVLIKMLGIYKFSKQKGGNENVIIVLGCRVRGDIPSRALTGRVDAAYRYLLSNTKSVAILSGGQGSDEFLSEALCMQNLLVQRGISKNRLLLEDRSTSTYENIRFSLEIMQKNGFSNEVGIVTSEYHQKRAALICSRFGLKTSPVSSKTKPTLIANYLLREMLGLIKESIAK